jgi:hypothetical protein
LKWSTLRYVFGQGAGPREPIAVVVRLPDETPALEKRINPVAR